MDALGILGELSFPGVTSETVITEQDARCAYDYALTHCGKKTKGWSVWKGLLMGADHLASATEEQKDRLPDLFTIPDLHFYNRQSELYPLSLIESDVTKRHSFVKAPTGAGKTDFLMKRCRGRIFYTLHLSMRCTNVLPMIWAIVWKMYGCCIPYPNWLLRITG